jgi:quinol monooxygenase YgiN
MDSAFLVIARWTIRRGEEAAVAALLDVLESASRAEPGCVSFEGFVSRTDARRVTLVERYADRAAFDAHRANAHFRSIVLERIVPLLDERSVEGFVLAAD